jgi:hypothetical protein
VDYGDLIRHVRQPSWQNGLRHVDEADIEAAARLKRAAMDAERRLAPIVSR